MNNMSVPHSVIHSSNFTNPDEAEDGGRKKDSGDVPKPKVSEREIVGHVPYEMTSRGAGPCGPMRPIGLDTTQQ